jgi:hypothetical protein
MLSVMIAYLFYLDFSFVNTLNFVMIFKTRQPSPFRGPLRTLRSVHCIQQPVNTGYRK